MGKPSVSKYVLKLFAGGKDLSNHLSSITIVTDIETPIQVIYLIADLGREQYEKYLLPYKDNIRLDILSGKGFSDDDDIPDVDASFSYELVLLDEFSQQTSGHQPDSISKPSRRFLICLPKQSFKQQQTLIKNIIFIDKTRKQMIEKIFSGHDLVLQSSIYKEAEIFEQIFIPPVRQVGAFNYLNQKIILFTPRPAYLLYSLDGKVYIGSCIKNNMQPLTILYSTGEEQMLNTTKASSQSSDIYDYTIIHPIEEEIVPSSISISLGHKQSYTFSPLNDLYSRYTSNLNEFDDNLFLENMYGSDRRVAKNIKNSNFKEMWYKEHNGFFNVLDANDNKVFCEHYVSQYLNQSISLKATIEGPIKFQDFLHIGRRINLVCDMNAKQYDGDYYLSKSSISFANSGKFCVGKTNIKIKSSTKVSGM